MGIQKAILKTIEQILSLLIYIYIITFVINGFVMNNHQDYKCDHDDDYHLCIK